MNLRNISVESIDFQSNSMGKEIELAIQSFKDEKVKNKDANESEEKRIIEAIISKHTSLKIKLDLETDAIACIYLPTIHRNHLFIYQHFREYFEQKESTKIFDKIREVKEKHTVNLKTAKVTGIFSELETEVHLSLNMLLGSGFTPAQITAILLHEVGHLFTLYEFVAREHYTNQVLAGVFKSVINKDSIKEREFVFEQAGIILGGNKDTLNELVNQNDTKVIAAVIYKKHIEYTKSELSTEIYDATSCEQLADQFATRFGYGRELIEGLDLLNKIFGSAEKSSSGNFLACFVQIAGTTSYLLLTILGAIVGNPVTVLAFGVLFLSVMFSSGASRNDYTYDILKTRYLRIREQLIQRLKDKTVTDAESKLTLENLSKIDSIIKETYEIKLPLDRLFDYLFSKDKSVRASIDLQRDLESLAMNDFFIKSKELSLA